MGIWQKKLKCTQGTCASLSLGCALSVFPVIKIFGCAINPCTTLIVKIPILTLNKAHMVSFLSTHVHLHLTIRKKDYVKVVSPIRTRNTSFFFSQVCLLHRCHFRSATFPHPSIPLTSPGFANCPLKITNLFHLPLKDITSISRCSLSHCSKACLLFLSVYICLVFCYTQRRLQMVRKKEEDISYEPK